MGQAVSSARSVAAGHLLGLGAGGGAGAGEAEVGRVHAGGFVALVLLDEGAGQPEVGVGVPGAGVLREDGAAEVVEGVGGAAELDAGAAGPVGGLAGGRVEEGGAEEVGEGFFFWSRSRRARPRATNAAG